MSYLQKHQRRRYGTVKTTHTDYALYYHLTWAVEEGLPLITKEVEEALKKFLVKKCKALEIILGIQDNVAEGLITKKGMAVWRKRPALHELDKTTIKLLLQKRYFPDEAREISDEQERALLQAA